MKMVSMTALEGDVANGATACGAARLRQWRRHIGSYLWHSNHTRRRYISASVWSTRAAFCKRAPYQSVATSSSAPIYLFSSWRLLRQKVEGESASLPLCTRDSNGLQTGNLLSKNM